MNASERARLKKEWANKKKASLIEWEFREGESDWQPEAITAPFPAAQPHRWGRRWWAAISSVLLLLLVALAGWLWYQAQLGLAEVDADLNTAVEADVEIPDRGDPGATLPVAITMEVKGHEQGLEVVETRIVDLRDDWAVVEVTLKHGNIPYRQRRVYQRTGKGTADEWSPVAPTAAYWGRPRLLESSYFIFHYYAADGSAISAAADKLDTLYPAIAASYLPAPLPETKREVWVSPEGSAQQAAAGIDSSAPSDTAVVVSSPSLNVVPATMSDGDLLAQSVVLRLLDQLTEEAVRRNISPSLQHTQAEEQLRALLQSVQMWQAWSIELPLAALRKPIVQWIYEDVGPSGSAHKKRVPPSFDAELCDLHRLWEDAPVMLQAPLFCGKVGPGDPYQMWRCLYVSPWWHLTSRSIFSPETPAEPQADLASVVGLATVLEYAAATYGPQRIATLIANTPFYSSWETLIPVTFGVSFVDFEGGWQSYLQKKYGIAPFSTR